MSELDFVQILDNLHKGVAVLDRDCKVLYWNHWMERSSGLEAAAVLGRPLTQIYPGLNTRAFNRNFASVISFGIVAFFSPRIHGQLFPFPPVHSAQDEFDFMQQRCFMGPLREGESITSVYLTVEDVTEIVTYQRRLAELAMRDGLTGAHNRRFFDMRFLEELDRAQRYGRSLGVVMFDIDLFKTVNDEYGHQFGDEALRAVAEACMKAIRTVDSFFRYGGEEFCLLIPESGLEEAQALAERLRLAIAAGPVTALGLTASLTVSAGVAASRPGDSCESLLARADAALYMAKDLGRNRVEVAS